MSWNYGTSYIEGRLTHVDIHAVAKEINGYFLADKVDRQANVHSKRESPSRLCPSSRMTFHFVGMLDLLQFIRRKGNLACQTGTKDASGSVSIPSGHELAYESANYL